MKIIFFLLICIFYCISCDNNIGGEIIPGERWLDTDGNPINAHGGGILYHEGTYYWYGEYKKEKQLYLIKLHGNVIGLRL